MGAKCRSLVGLAALISACNAVVAETSTWNRTGGGNWSDAAIWSGGLPDTPGDVAVIGSALPSTSDVNINVAVAATVGSLMLNSGRSPIVQGPGLLTFDGGVSLA